MAVCPNLLWIVTTQWRAQACGFAGDPNARTPCLDRLAAESLNFTQAVTPHPFGPLARAAMLTGVPSPENGVRDYFDPLPSEARTLAHTLGERGYATAFFGKWHLWKRDPSAALVGEAHAKIVVPPEARGGFEFWEGFEGGFLLNDPWLHGTRLAQPERFQGYQSDVICARAKAWLGEKTPNAKFQRPRPEGLRRESKVESQASAGQRPEASERTLECESRPWFCVVSLEAPHPPYAASAAGVKASEPNAIELPANVPRGGEIEARARRELAGYYAHIEATDRAIGRLLSTVPGDSTLVVFTSVHGDMHGAHGLFRKGWPYEESVRVPLLVRVPTGAESQESRVQRRPDGGRTPDGGGPVSTTGGEQRDDPVSLADLPRLMLAEIEKWKAENRARKSEVGEWAFETGNPFARISMPSVVRLPQQCDREWRGVRAKTRKLVLQADGSPWLFFDLENDPLELCNLARDAAWAREIAEWRAQVG
jgi:arylsulfatase A-like enzyme